MNSSEMYKVAYDAHYKKKNYSAALNGYLKIIRSFSDSSEAKYALQQISNLKKMRDFESILIDEENVSTYEQIIGEYEARIQSMKEEALAKEVKKAEDKRKKEELELRIKDMILTTAPFVDGYDVTVQHGLVFGEVFIKMGFLKNMVAAFEDIGAILSFGDNELSGSTSLLDDAREYAIKKMKYKAIKKGANAIIGIDSESSIGDSIIKISIMGTAVTIEKHE